MLTSQTVNNRISVLWGKIANTAGFDMKEVQGCGGGQGQAKEDSSSIFSISDKLELVSYLRILTFIHFSPKHHLAGPALSRNWRQAQGEELKEKERDIFLSLVSMTPLLTKLLSSKGEQLSITSDA